jgi:hypothetical protein
MSSLPPYNPPSSDHTMWLLNSATPPVDRERLLDVVPDAEVVYSDDLESLRELVRSGAPDVVVVAAETTLETLVLGLIGGTLGRGRMRFLPGALSQIQMFPDRALVRHLNAGINLPEPASPAGS